MPDSSQLDEVPYPVDRDCATGVPRFRLIVCAFALETKEIASHSENYKLNSKQFSELLTIHSMIKDLRVHRSL